MTTYILARTLKEAHAFATEDLGLARGRYRVVTTPSIISSARGADLYLVPGYEQRFDRFAVKGALRYTRLNVIKVGEDVAEAPVTDGLVPEGEQLTIVGDDVHNGDEMVAEGAPAWDANIPPEMLAEEIAIVEAAEAQQAEEPVKRRRSRCKTCQTLHFKDEPCPSEVVPGT